MEEHALILRHTHKIRRSGTLEDMRITELLFNKVPSLLGFLTKQAKKKKKKPRNDPTSNKITPDSSILALFRLELFISA